MKIQNPDWNKLNPKKSIRGVIFDMDGTLFTSETILHPAYVDAINLFNKEYDFGVKIPSLEEILFLVGQPTKVIFANLFPDLSLEYRTILNNYSLQNLCDSILSGKGIIYDGAPEMLRDLDAKRYTLSIASNGRMAYLSSILKGFGLSKLFIDVVTLEREGIDSKADIITYYMNLHKWQPGEVIMIGDRTSDIEAARVARVWFAGVLWGHGPLEEIKDSDIFLDKPQDLADML